MPMIQADPPQMRAVAQSIQRARADVEEQFHRLLPLAAAALQENSGQAVATLQTRWELVVRWELELLSELYLLEQQLLAGAERLEQADVKAATGLRAGTGQP